MSLFVWRLRLDSLMTRSMTTTSESGRNGDDVIVADLVIENCFVDELAVAWDERSLFFQLERSVHILALHMDEAVTATPVAVLKLPEGISRVNQLQPAGARDAAFLSPNGIRVGAVWCLVYVRTTDDGEWTLSPPMPLVAHKKAVAIDPIRGELHVSADGRSAGVADDYGGVSLVQVVRGDVGLTNAEAENITVTTNGAGDKEYDEYCFSLLPWASGGRCVGVHERWEAALFQIGSPDPRET
jgi:hypothetical protein